MPGTDASPSVDRNFEEIEAAVLESARGRWFLAEYASRNRTADTRSLLDAIGRLESTLIGRSVSDDLARLRADLSEMSSAIQRMKSEVAEGGSSDGSRQLLEASQALDGIVRTTEAATSSILDATEHIQEAAWLMREQGADAALCDALDHRATEIYAACEFQDLTAQRTAKVVKILGFLEQRIAAMSRAWGAEAPVGARAPTNRRDELGLTQSDIDFVIVEKRLADPAAAPSSEPPSEAVAAATPPPPVAADRPDDATALADIDRLSTAEKLRLFT